MKDQIIAFGHAALSALLPIVATLLTALLAMCGQKLHAYIDAKVKNERLKGIFERLNDAAWTAVTSVEQAVISKVDASKPLGEIAITAKNDALAELKTHLGPAGIAEMKSILGLTDADLEKLLLSQIESKVHMVNQANPPKEKKPAVDAPNQAAAAAGGAA